MSNPGAEVYYDIFGGFFLLREECEAIVDYVSGILTASWDIFKEASIYLLFGFVVAGLIRVYLQPGSVAHYFRRGRIRSVIYASLLGIPIPL